MSIGASARRRWGNRHGFSSRSAAPLHRAAGPVIESLENRWLLSAGDLDTTFGAGQGNAEYLETLAKNLFRGLPRRARRPFEEAAIAYGPAPKPRLDDWLLRVRRTSTRAALVACGDSAAAISVLRRTDGDLSGLEGPLRERGMSVLSDALRFAVSDLALSVRRRIGVSE